MAKAIEINTALDARASGTSWLYIDELEADPPEKYIPKEISILPKITAKSADTVNKTLLPDGMRRRRDDIFTFLNLT